MTSGYQLDVDAADGGVCPVATRRMIGQAGTAEGMGATRKLSVAESWTVDCDPVGATTTRHGRPSAPGRPVCAVRLKQSRLRGGISIIAPEFENLAQWTGWAW